MKKCPTCNRTFADDALSFCLQDGSALLSVGGGQPQGNDLGATMQYTPGRPTNPPPPFTPAQFPAQPPQQQWAPTPPVGGMQGQQRPPKKSKALFWVLGIAAVAVVLTIGGIILAFVLVDSDNTNTNSSNSNNSNSTANENSNKNDNSSNANSTPSKVAIAQDDFTVPRWWVGSNIYGKGEYVNNEYQLTGGSLGGYIGVYGLPTYLTKDATTKITVRNVYGRATEKGFGLTVFGELKNGQLDDYSFLIRTDENASFRVVSHGAGTETTLIDWTAAPQIRAGTSSNQLEVRASESQLAFYINGTFATSVTYTGRNPTGVAGAYTSGMSTIAFDDLEIFK